ncbi:rod shape-determining protein MreC [Melissococcus plutonius]|uniref:Cell shape-determining protein MreC n=1 Tax=Melissococcus plutonius (strain ATCC 35311 / DSM 29964 / CIP 104052 / LMG 20360 / NCIMB 702443) TaxID=940190 RepID=F3Y8H8_MELPT|nr:rod shape-determining protein MreC [Melissococcus plutonius]AIM24515.1 cell shape-determining protein MreC [Melissococcus plutonius S1]KMT24564.1 cell shape-determining protein MreC [Melissococcus plutonius]KMT27277.1 cell shape-determining protein MreC [Melissococcus plutonius]KMT27450.1 cell shape-determining protein MreC [Melissococcus plutonius]KMT29224.1 cell shape-determining protein MreC [Melissococcus plutonius]
MKKFNPNKNIIIALLLVIIIVVFISLTAAQRTNKGKANIVQSTISDGIGLIDKAISFPARTIENGTTSISNLMNTYKENERLKEKIDDYNELRIQNHNYQKEIGTLKEELGLNETLTNYETITANVITRSPDTWQDILIIDRGTKDGLKANMAVMAQKGLVGRIIEVNRASAKVELITSKNITSNHFPVHISSKNGESYGLLKNYNDKAQTLTVSQLTGNTQVKAGDVVQTSGLGGNSPADLPVGTVQKVKSGSYGLDREVAVKPYANVYGVSIVTVVKRSAGEE